MNIEEACMNKLKFYEYENMEDFYRHEGTTVIQATGEDAEDYLQSQWSIDLRKLQIGHVRYGLRLSSKGKILAGAYIARIEEEEFFLISPENTGVQIIKLMEENVVADEVEFLDVSKSWQMHSLFTEGSESPNLIPQVDLSALQMQKFVKLENGILMADEKMPNAFYLTLAKKIIIWKNILRKDCREFPKKDMIFSESSLPTTRFPMKSAMKTCLRK